jgi:hypothetical protein
MLRRLRIEGGSSDDSNQKRAAVLRLVREVSQGENLASYLSGRVHQSLEPPRQDDRSNDSYRLAAGGFNGGLEGDGVFVSPAGIGRDLRRCASLGPFRPDDVQDGGTAAGLLLVGFPSRNTSRKRMLQGGQSGLSATSHFTRSATSPACWSAACSTAAPIR